MWIRSILIAVVLFVAQASAFAHLEGITDTNISVGQSHARVVYTVPTSDLSKLGVGVDIENAIVKGFEISNLGEPCEGTVLDIKNLENIASKQFFMRYICNNDIKTLDIEYKLLVDLPASHENFARVSVARRNKNIVFSREVPRHQVPVETLLNLSGKSVISQAEDLAESESIDKISFFSSIFQSSHYISVGFDHILLGFDHILFLVGLLLLPLGIRSLFWITTTFTLAHSITLALSVFNVVSLPPFIVESAIAFSIIYIAVENIWELRKKQRSEIFQSPLQRRIIVTFLFGLIHGFGFSYILKEIGLGEQMIGALLFFNLGVECGQLAIVVLVLPLLTLLFRRPSNAHASWVGSIFVACIGAFWFVERLISAFSM